MSAKNKFFDVDAKLDKEEAKKRLSKPIDGDKQPRKVKEPTTSATYQLPKSLIKELAVARLDDGISATARVTALLRLWHDDAELQQRVKDFIAS